MGFPPKNKFIGEDLQLLLQSYSEENPELSWAALTKGGIEDDYDYKKDGYRIHYSVIMPFNFA